MLKSDRVIKKVNTSVFQYGIPTPHSVAIPSLFMKNKDDPLFIESVIGLRNGKGGLFICTSRLVMSFG